MNDTQKLAIGGGLVAAIVGGVLWSRGGAILGPIGAIATVSGIVVATAGVVTAVGTPKRRRMLTAGERSKKCKGTSEIQSLIFPRDRFTIEQAKTWAKRNGFKRPEPDVKENTIRLRQQSPKGFRRMRIKTIDKKRGVKAVVAWRSC